MLLAPVAHACSQRSSTRCVVVVVVVVWQRSVSVVVGPLPSPSKSRKFQIPLRLGSSLRDPYRPVYLACSTYPMYSVRVALVSTPTEFLDSERRIERCLS